MERLRRRHDLLKLTRQRRERDNPKKEKKRNVSSTTQGKKEKEREPHERGGVRVRVPGEGGVIFIFPKKQGKKNS